MTSQKDLSATDAGKRGISLLTDNTSHWSYRGKTFRRFSEPPVNVRDSELDLGSLEVTLPKAVPPREATVELSLSDYITVEDDAIGERKPVLPEPPQPEKAAEDSVAIDLRSLAALSGAGAPENAPKPPASEPSRESSVFTSLAELTLIEDQRVEGEHADACAGQLRRFGESLAELKGNFGKIREAYLDWGIEMPEGAEGGIAALESKLTEFEAKLASLKGEIQLRPNQEGYKARKTLIAEIDGLSNEIDKAVMDAGAGEIQNRSLVAALEREKRENDRIEAEETVEGEKPKITRITKYYQEEGEGHVLGAGYRLELVKIEKGACAFSLESKGEGYEQTFSVPAGKEGSIDVSRGMKLSLEWDGPGSAGRYRVKVTVVTKKVPSDESLERGVDELLDGLPAVEQERSVDVDLESIESDAPKQEKPKGAVAKLVSGFFGLFKKEQAKDADAAHESSGTTQEVSLSDVEVEQPDTGASKPDGIPWVDKHTEVELNENELAICEGVLEERKSYWILPAPAAETAGHIDLKIIEKFRNEPKVRLGGKMYFILDAAEGFSGAKRISRIGKTLHIWPEAMTDYDYLGSLSIEIRDPKKEAEWPEKFSYYQMTLEEAAENNYFFPENRARFMHPVPEQDTKNERDRAILDYMKGTQQITLGGRKYYLLNISSVSEWREIALYMPKTRIVSRGGNWLSIWEQKENGYFMFFNSTRTDMEYFGTKLPSIKEKKGVKVYDSEKADLEKVFDSMQNVYFYELDNIRDMNAGELSWIVKSANATIQGRGISPLVSAGGRWYVALDIFIPESVKAGFNGEYVVALTQGTDPKERIAEMKRKLASRRSSSIPAPATLPEDVIRAMPEGEVKFLYYIGPENQGVALQRASVDMTVGDEKNTYIIIDNHMEGVIPVVRRGMKLFMAKGSFGGRPAQEGEDSVELDIDT
jgi:hypothetical protein